MESRTAKPTSPGRRHRSTSPRPLPSDPPRSLTRGPVRTTSGRNSSGRITVRHRGGGHKRILRVIDFKRDKLNIPGRVDHLEYDPNRSVPIALVVYPDGDKRFILAPQDLKPGDTIQAGDTAPITPGNALPLGNIPVGTPIHNIELRPGKGGQLARSAGAAATIQSKEPDTVAVVLPSGELRRIPADSRATIGQLGNPEHQSIKLGKAGRRRHMGWRPAVRGVAMHPGAHPHGGGEGRSGIGMPSPKTPWGKPTLGKKTRKRRKYSDRHIIKPRKRK